MKLAKILAAVCVLGLVGYVLADEPTTKPSHPNALQGKVVKVEGTDVTIHTRKHGEVVVKTDDKTVVTIDDNDAKVSDLKEGMRVWVTPPEGVATKITARTKPPTTKPSN